MKYSQVVEKKVEGKKYYDEITIAKGIAIVLAVFGHSFPDAVKNFWIIGDNSSGSYIFNWIYSFHMYVFFVCAGFLFIPKLNLYDNIKEQFKKRAKRLLIPYFFFSLTYFILKTFFGKFADHPLNDNAFVMIFFGESPCYGVWFLWTLFVISFLCILLKRMTMFGLLIISLSLFLGLNNSDIPNPILKISNFMVWFILGGVLAVYYKYFQLIRCKFILGVLLFFCSLVAECFVVEIPIQLMIFIKHFIGVMWVMFLSFEIAYRSGWIKKILKFIGNYCMDIYILSMFILVPLRILYVNFGLMNYIPYWIYVFSSTIFGLAIPCVMSKYVVRRNNILKILLIGA